MYNFSKFITESNNDYSIEIGGVKLYYYMSKAYHGDSSLTLYKASKEGFNNHTRMDEEEVNNIKEALKNVPNIKRVSDDRFDLVAPGDDVIVSKVYVEFDELVEVLASYIESLSGDLDI